MDVKHLGACRLSHWRNDRGGRGWHRCRGEQDRRRRARAFALPLARPRRVRTIHCGRAALGAGLERAQEASAKSRLSMRISRSRGHSPIASSPGCGSICLPTWGGDAPWLYLPLLLVDMGTRRGMEIDRVHLNPAAGGLASSARRRLGGKRRACGACFPTASQAVFGKRARSKKARNCWHFSGARQAALSVNGSSTKSHSSRRDAPTAPATVQPPRTTFHGAFGSRHQVSGR